MLDIITFVYFPVVQSPISANLRLPRITLMSRITKIADVCNFCSMILKTIFNLASWTALTKIADLTEITKMTNIAIFSSKSCSPNGNFINIYPKQCNYKSQPVQCNYM